MNLGIIIIVALVALWALGAFLGIVGGLSKPFAHSPGIIDSSDIKSQEQQTIDETDQKQKELMDDMKQKLQDQQDKKF